MAKQTNKPEPSNVRETMQAFVNKVKQASPEPEISQEPPKEPLVLSHPEPVSNSTELPQEAPITSDGIQWVDSESSKQLGLFTQPEPTVPVTASSVSALTPSTAAHLAEVEVALAKEELAQALKKYTPEVAAKVSGERPQLLRVETPENKTLVVNPAAVTAGSAGPMEVHAVATDTVETTPSNLPEETQARLYRVVRQMKDAEKMFYEFAKRIPYPTFVAFSKQMRDFIRDRELDIQQGIDFICEK